MNHSLSLAAINCNGKNVHGYNMTENKDIDFCRQLRTKIIKVICRGKTIECFSGAELHSRIDKNMA